MKTLLSISTVFVIVLIQSCAQIAAPSGGEPDTDYPVLDSIGTFPLNYSTNFRGSQIVMTFDEYFVLKNPTSNVFFSPSIEKEPEYIVKGKTLTVLLNNELKANTTYTINFGDAISDYTVGNKIPDFKYVFSTGSFIDSMETKGKVLDALSGKPISDVLVMLYDQTEDSIVSKQRPTYYTLSSKEGNYSLTNLKSGSYKVFALKDENRNFLYDLPNEQVGSLDSLLNLTSDSLKRRQTLFLYTKDYIKQGITTKKYEYPGKLTLGFARPVEDWQVSFLDSIPVAFLEKEMSENRDSLILWGVNIGSSKSTLNIKLDTTTQTVNIYPFKTPTKNLDLSQPSISRSLDASQPLEFVFDRPLAEVKQNFISLKKDTTLVRFDSIKTDLKTLSLFFSKNEDQSYHYTLLPGAVKDVFQTTNKDTLEGLVSVKKSSYYGSFTLKLIPTKGSLNYIVSLLDEKGKKVKTKPAKGDTSLTFLKLTPGKYTIQAIEDINANGNWDTGDYYKKKKPEQVFNFPIEITIRSNWDLTESWIID